MAFPVHSLPYIAQRRVFDFVENTYYFKMLQESGANVKYASYMDYKNVYNLINKELKRPDLGKFLLYITANYRNRVAREFDGKYSYKHYKRQLVENMEDWLIEYDEEMIKEAYDKNELCIEESFLFIRFQLLLIPLHIGRIVVNNVSISVAVRGHRYLNRISYTPREQILIKNRVNEGSIKGWWNIEEEHPDGIWWGEEGYEEWKEFKNNITTVNEQRNIITSLTLRQIPIIIKTIYKQLGNTFFEVTDTSDTWSIN